MYHREVYGNIASNDLTVRIIKPNEADKMKQVDDRSRFANMGSVHEYGVM